MLHSTNTTQQFPKKIEILNAAEKQIIRWIQEWKKTNSPGTPQKEAPVAKGGKAGKLPSPLPQSPSASSPTNTKGAKKQPKAKKGTKKQQQQQQQMQKQQMQQQQMQQQQMQQQQMQQQQMQQQHHMQQQMQQQQMQQQMQLQHQQIQPPVKGPVNQQLPSQNHNLMGASPIPGMMQNNPIPPRGGQMMTNYPLQNTPPQNANNYMYSSPSNSNMNQINSMNMMASNYDRMPPIHVQNNYQNVSHSSSSMYSNGRMPNDAPNSQYGSYGSYLPPSVASQYSNLPSQVNSPSNDYSSAIPPLQIPNGSSMHMNGSNPSSLRQQSHLQGGLGSIPSPSLLSPSIPSLQSGSHQMGSSMIPGSMLSMQQPAMNMSLPPNFGMFYFQKKNIFIRVHWLN